MNREDLQRRLRLGDNNNNNHINNVNHNVNNNSEIHPENVNENIIGFSRSHAASDRASVSSYSASGLNSSAAPSSSNSDSTISSSNSHLSEDDLIRSVIPRGEDEYLMILQNYCDNRGITLEQYFNGENGDINNDPIPVDRNHIAGPIVLADDGLDEEAIRNPNLNDPARDPQITVNLLRNSIDVGQRLVSAIAASEASEMPEATQLAVQRATESIANYVGNNTRGGNTALLNAIIMGAGVLAGGALMYFAGRMNNNSIPSAATAPASTVVEEIAGFNWKWDDKFWIGLIKKK